MSESQEEAKPPVIVVIDDDREVLDLTALILRRKGFVVHTSTCAREGLEIIASASPDLALMDYMMPEMDGLLALKEIKGRFPDTYVVMFTGKGSEEIAVALMKAGASEYILKPFNNRDLVERIENVLRIRRIELHNRELQEEREQLLKEIEGWNLELQQRVREKSEALQKAQNEIVQSEKLAALGYLAAGMAHEIRNPLNTISLFIQLMRQNCTDAEQLELTSKMLKEVDRVDSIIRKLLDASRRTRSIESDVRIEQVLESALEIFSHQFEAHHITVETLLPPLPLPGLRIDPMELEQIFTNLFLNALDEMRNGGTLRISLESGEGSVVARISDTGGGIPEDSMDRIFDPFYTTKSRGTGMGLPVVQRIARIYHGSVEVESTSLSGTVFKVTLPSSTRS